MMSALKIVFASSEVAPFAKTGGLADVSSSLPAALASLGHVVKIVMPMYRSVMEGNFNLKPVENELEVPFKGKVIRDRVYYSELEPNLLVYFIKHDKFFDRSMLYRNSKGDYTDNAERFIFFSRGILQFLKLIAFQPDILHCNDWQTGLVPAYIKSLSRNEPFFRNTRTIFTIHNLAYQGIFSKKYMEASELPVEFFSIDGLEYYDKMNFMKSGIVFSDFITTVSPKYSHEIRTPEFGCGLDGILKKRSDKIYGILNGVDYTSWNPEADSHIIANYDENDLSGKMKCKQELVEIFKLKGGKKIPVIGMISRLAAQKGFDILFEAMSELLKLKVFLVLLGKGDEQYETRCAELGQKYKGSLGAKIAFDNALAHKIEAGSDMFLMPSRYEPCGLNQMYSLKYGTIPIVRATGGLDNTVKEFDIKTTMGNGFKFFDYSSEALIKAVKKALTVYGNKTQWLRLVKNAMKEDFSWKRFALQYEEIYRQALGIV